MGGVVTTKNGRPYSTQNNYAQQAPGRSNNARAKSQTRSRLNLQAQTNFTNVSNDFGATQLYPQGGRQRNNYILPRIDTGLGGDTRDQTQTQVALSEKFANFDLD